MSTFSPKQTSPYRKAFLPADEASRTEYLDQQFRAIERSIKLLTDSVIQLQQEVPLLWAALNALGQTRP